MPTAYDASTWLNSVNSGGRSSGAMPMPVSVTEIRTASRAAGCGAAIAGGRRRSARTVTSPCGGVNLMAFDSRFTSTCRARVSSATKVSGSSARSTTTWCPFAVSSASISPRMPGISARTSTGARVSFHPPGIHLGQVEHIVDQAQQVAAVAGDGLERVVLVGRERPWEPASRISEKPITELSGVRSSCDMLARNWAFIRLARSTSPIFTASSRLASSTER